MYTIMKEFSFEASHQLIGLPEGHKCSNVHGHSYRVRVELSDLPDAIGFIRDYRDLDDFKRYIDQEIDHRHLNEVIPAPPNGSMNNTTAEHLAFYFYQWCRGRWPEVVAVHVSETKKTWASYREVR
jgi:6-pyruvoyltetrahydropterin/6-carboxytetrahydropterin synthase